MLVLPMHDTRITIREDLPISLVPQHLFERLSKIFHQIFFDGFADILSFVFCLPFLVGHFCDITVI